MSKPRLKEAFIAAHLVGVDQSKRGRVQMWVVFFLIHFWYTFNTLLILNSCFVDCLKCSPEATGVVAGCVFLITMYLFIPIPFLDSWPQVTKYFNLPVGSFDHRDVSWNASIFSMTIFFMPVYFLCQYFYTNILMKIFFTPIFPIRYFHVIISSLHSSQRYWQHFYQYLACYSSDSLTMFLIFVGDTSCCFQWLHRFLFWWFMLSSTM